MSSATRVLFLAGEVNPFTPGSSIGRIVRQLPEQIHETGRFETRVMMPRYGIISERRNRLHEVIRLSGAEIDVLGETHTLKVKVASIPGIRLQVYFMDNTHFFKRKGVIASRDGVVFKDNVQRSFFFGRAVLETIRNLGWEPHVVHAFGWAGGLVPLALGTDFAEDPLLGGAKVVFTPDDLDPKAKLTSKMCAGLALPDELAGLTLNEVGKKHAHAVIYPPNVVGNGRGPQFPEDIEGMTQMAMGVYDELVGVPA
jgi:starch synthase